MRRRHLAALLGTAALAAGAAVRATAATATFPNAPVVLISIDTLRADRLPAYGYTKVRTPFLDRFRRDAWLFENAFTPCPLTLPAHTTMLTGLLPPEHGVRDNAGFAFDGRAHASLPRLLEERGYATGAAVSSYVLRYETGLGQLFDFYEDSVGTTPGVDSVHYRRPGDRTAAVARAWIGKHAAEPFFFFFHIYEPHLPYDPPEPFRTEYGVSYDAEVATSDAIVGAFLEELKRLGVYDRAVVIVTADHGEGLGDHGEEQHGIFVYREAVRVPLLLKLPRGVGAGSGRAEPAQLSDIFRTVAAALGLPRPAAGSGASLLAAARASEAARVLYGETFFPRLHLGWSELRSVIEGRFHYIHGPRPELYNMTADPAERHDLVKGEPATATRLAKELETFPHGAAKPAPVDQETLRRLAALGYIGGVSDRDAAAELPNPADGLKYLTKMQEAWRLAEVREFRPAVEVLRAVVKESPGIADAWVKLGDLWSELADDEESAAAYRQALERSPVFVADTALRLGLAELRRQRFDEAEKLARRSLGDVPAAAHELLARVALGRGDVAGAESEARSAAASRNPQPSAILVMAEVKLRAGKPAEALEAVDRAQACARGLRLASVYNLEFLRGDALGRLDRVDEAEKAFRAEIAAFPAHAQPYANLAVIRFLKRDPAGVDRLMEEMAHASPNKRTYLLAAATYRTLGNSTRAEAWRRRAAAEFGPAPTP